MMALNGPYYRFLHRKSAQKDKHKCTSDASSVPLATPALHPCHVFITFPSFSQADTFALGPYSNRVRSPSNGSPEKWLWFHTVVHFRILSQNPSRISLCFNYQKKKKKLENAPQTKQRQEQRNKSNETEELSGQSCV